MISFTIFLDNNIKKPLYEQLYDYIKNEIVSEQIKPKSKLPSKRKLANHLQVSLNTVQGAYDQLLSEGYIYALPKKGYYVSDLEELLHLNSVERIKEEIPEKDLETTYNFSYEGVDFSNFPFKVWKKLSCEVIDKDDKDLVIQGSPQGYPKLKAINCRIFTSFSRGFL
ncbi:GntR family transcriptional regulator [endosymbiont 'TC1' of Trimyema compressum]|uniref:GntR family transcriptional regulator n=1 Tax=endosymbiont 'TC1' of Trimyema compressum TaxID=243899 RepID=UPI001FE0EE85|nr:GntR family transcriptional regulator [endosymbiont 'TC1' of Trimyema compressum]